VAAVVVEEAEAAEVPADFQEPAENFRRKIV
jgi:hypothetical protein